MEIDKYSNLLFSSSVSRMAFSSLTSKNEAYILVALAHIKFFGDIAPEVCACNGWFADTKLMNVVWAINMNMSAKAPKSKILFAFIILHRNGKYMRKIIWYKRGVWRWIINQLVFDFWTDMVSKYVERTVNTIPRNHWHQLRLLLPRITFACPCTSENTDWLAHRLQSR